MPGFVIWFYLRASITHLYEPQNNVSTHFCFL